VNTTWPASGVRAIFGGTAGAVTVAGGGVTANIADFQTTGYTVTGGAINIGSDAAKFTNTVSTNTTRIDAPLTGSAPSQFAGGGIFVIGGNNTSLSGPVTQVNGLLGITNNNALGTATFTMGAAGNTFFSALDGDRTLANNVVFAGNRMIINNNALSTGLTVGNLTIDGSLALNCIAPADLYLRRSLTVNGVVSGSNSNIGILFGGDTNTLKLTNSGNDFTGNITWGVGSTVEVDSNGALGALANTLKFNVTGSLKMGAAFSGTHPIIINNFGAGAAGTTTTLAQFNTNSFDTTWTGTISAPVFSAPAVAQQITTFVKQGDGILTLDSGGTTANNLRSGGIRVDGGTLNIASGAITTGSATANGVSGNCFLEIDGGSLSSGNFVVGKSAGTATFTLSSGTYINSLELLVAFNLGDGIVNIDGGLADLNNFSMVDKTGLTSTMNLNGGEVRLNFFNARANSVGNTAVANINFNGCTVRAENNHADFIDTTTNTIINANVQAGGAIFDTTNGLTNSSITIKQPLVHDPALGATLDGGLTKKSLGTLTLTAANTYTGPTSVQGGSLLINGDNSAATGAISIDATAGLGGDGTINAATYADGAKLPWTVADWTAAPGLSGGAVTIDGALTVVVDDAVALANFTDATTSFTILSASALTVTNPAGLSVDATAFTIGTGTWAVQKDGNALKLVYTVAPVGGYTTWSATNAGNQAADLDFDNDGVSNGVEYFMGQTGSSFTANPGPIAGKVTWPKDPAFVGSFKVQVSDTLALGGWTDIVPPDASIDETNPNQVVYTLPTGAPKKFARLNVTVTP
jgi:autotransporter-associated beta strand protein